jgi:hypothetical protein
MTMLYGTIGTAFSRLTPKMARVSYTFVLMAPPVPIEQIEGILNREILRKELAKLHRIPDEMNYK